MCRIIMRRVQCNKDRSMLNHEYTARGREKAGMKATGTKKYFLRAFLASLPLVAVFCAQKRPEISVSPAHVKMGDPVQLTGTGFTPNRSVMSHLRRPDGSEYNPLRFRTTERGEFSHKIDTVMLDVGTFELWAEDEASKTVSNRTQFSVE